MSWIRILGMTNEMFRTLKSRNKMVTLELWEKEMREGLDN